MSLLDTLLEAARYIELQERRLHAEEEPKSGVCVRGAAVARPVSPAPAPAAPAPAPALVPAAAPPEPPALAPAPPAPLLDFAQEHSRPRTTTNNTANHGSTQTPSPVSVCSSSSGNSNGNAPRAGTREVHNKLEKNRRAHLKECFELLKRQLPATPDDKKTSNLSILGSAIRYIQVLRRKERECEHEMERLAREKIAAQQRLAALKREVSVRAAVTVRPRPRDPVSEDKDREEHVNGQILGISSVGVSSPPLASASPPHSLSMSAKLRTLPIQITPTTSQQVVRTSYGARHNTLTLTTLAPPPETTTQQNGHALENGVTTALSSALVHPTQIHLPISQVVGGGGLVVGNAALQLLSAGGVRVLHAPAPSPLHRPNGVTSGENNRIPKTENGIVTSSSVTTTEGGGVLVNGLTPIVVSQPATHLLQTHTLTHKMVETATAMVGNGVGVGVGVSVSQYLSAALVKPVVVVSSAPEPT